MAEPTSSPLDTLLPDQTYQAPVPSTGDVNPSMLSSGVSGGQTGQVQQEAGDTGQYIHPSWGENVMYEWYKRQQDAPLNFEGGGTLVRAIGRSLRDLTGSDKSPTLQPDEANKKYPGLPKPFTSPISDAEASIIYSTNVKRTQADPWMSTGPEPGALGETLLFASGFIDPTNVAIAVAGAATGGFGIALLAERYGAGVLFKNTATGLAPKIFPTVFAENLVINSALEVPSYLQLKHEQQDITTTDALKNIAISTALSTGIHAGIDYFFGQKIKAEEVGRRYNQTAEDNLKNARRRGDGAPYSFDHMDHPSERTMFGGVTHEGSPVFHSEMRNPTGVDLTDRMQQSVNSVGSPEGGVTGRVGHFTIDPEAKFLNLETLVDQPLSKEFIARVEDRIGTINKEGTITLDDVIAKIRNGDFEPKSGVSSKPNELGALKMTPEQALIEAGNIAQELGFKGYKFIHEVDGELSHGATILDKSAVKEFNEFTPATDSIPRMTPGEADKANAETMSDRNAHYYDPVADEYIKQTEGKAPITPEEIQTEMDKATEETLNKLKKQPDLTPDKDGKITEEQMGAKLDKEFIDEQLKELKKMEARAKQTQSIIDAMIDCGLDGIT